MIAPSARAPILDGLRGVAAIAVLLYHIGQSAALIQLAPFGFLAVDLFFMMSGYVIAKTYEPRFACGLGWTRFAVVRVARLYPMLVLGVLFAALWQINRGPALVPQVARALLLMPDLSAPVLFPLDAVLWSLFYELVLNLVHAITARWFTPARLAVGTALCGAAFLIAIWLYHGAGVGWDGHTFLAGFARAGWGYGVGLVLARTQLRLPAWAAWALLASAVVLLLAPAIGPNPVRVLGSLFVAFPLAVAAASRVTVAGGERLAGWLGGLSYPLYTTHLPLLGLAATLPWPESAGYRITMAAGLPFLAVGMEWAYDAPIRARFKSALATNRV